MDASEYPNMRSEEDRHWWYLALRDYTLRRVKDLAGDRKSSFSILDAGCGTGGMLARLQKEFPGARLRGIDASPQAVQLCRERGLGADVVEGSVDALPFEDEIFDIILSLDVLCHRQVDENAAFAEVVRTLKPGGAFIVNLPAFQFLTGRHDKAVHSARRYRRHQLGALLAGHGLAVEKIRYWNSFLFPAILLWRLATRRSAARTEADGKSDVHPTPGLINRLLLGVVLTDQRIGEAIPIPFGTSVFGVARKPETLE